MNPDLLKNLKAKIKFAWEKISKRREAVWISDRATELTFKFGRLNKQRQDLVWFLVAAVLFSFSYKAFYKPGREALREIRETHAGLKRQQQKLKAELPDIAEEKRRLEEAARSLKEAQIEIGRLEAKLPEQSSLPSLLGELVLIASGYPIDFTSIKPLERKDKTFYSRLDIEMRFKAPFEALTNYLNRLESLNQFLNASELSVESSSEGIHENAEIVLIMSTLLNTAGKAAPETKIQTELEKIKPVEVSRDPFYSKFMPKHKQEQVTDIHITGIINRGRKSTAIINDAMVHIGDDIAGFRVLEILPNAVILRRGQDNLVLRIHQE